MERVERTTATVAVMDQLPKEERVAVLLNLLGPEAADSVLMNLTDDQAGRVRQAMKGLDEDDYQREDIDAVVKEFERFFAYAQQTARMFDGDDNAEEGDASGEADHLLQVFQPTDDPFEDLERLSPLQIAGALRAEHPRTIALVVNCLDSEKAAETIRFLPEQTASSAFLQLSQEPAGSRQLLERIVRTTVSKALAIEPDNLEEVDSEQKIGDLLRAMNKKSRNAMLEALGQEEPEKVVRIKSFLYIFEDLGLLERKSMQKLLGEIDTGTLSRALVGADEAITGKVFANLSRRAGQALRDELEFLDNADPDEVDAARQRIAEAMAKLDESGDLQMEGASR